jgi:hypothetical protein
MVLAVGVDLKKTVPQDNDPTVGITLLGPRLALASRSDANSSFEALSNIGGETKGGIPQ